jgi:hypothetical protein
MGKKSREKKIRKETENLNAGSKKILKKLIRETKPEPFEIDGKLVYYNPLKRTLEGDKYISEKGQAVTKEMVEQYEKFLKQRYQQEKIAKANNVDINKIDEGVK